MNKKLIDVIWEELEKYTVTTHKTEESDQHIYSISGLIDKHELERAIRNYIG